MIAYKFLREGGRGLLTSCYWPQPMAGRPGAWLEVEGPLIPCRHGLHACSVSDLAHWIGDELWEVELAGDCIAGPDGLVASRARLTRAIESFQGEAAHSFARACVARAAEHVAAAGLPQAHRAARYLEQAQQFARDARPASLASYAAALAISACGRADCSLAAFRAERLVQARLLADAVDLKAR